MSDYDREKWQAEEASRDVAQSAYRDKMTRARERSADNAKRKIARLHAKLTELGHISDFEDEFGESVLERLDKFGSAFHDREKGRAGDALSIAQKQVVARMNKKVKELKAKQQAGEDTEADPDSDYVRTADRWKKEAQKKSSFKSKRKPSYSPRVRHIEDDMPDIQPDLQSAPVPPPAQNMGPPKLVAVTVEPARLTPDITSKDPPYIPAYTPRKPASGAKRPFLRIVPKTTD